MIKEYQLRKLQNSYEVTLNYKGVKVRVAFTGGNVYKGTMPKYRTDNPFKQKAIEASSLYNNKEVVLLRTIGAADTPPAAVQQGRKTDARRPVKPDQKKTTRTAGGRAGKTETKPAGTGTPEGKAEDADTKTFANLAEAIMFVAQEYQVGVQTEAEARSVLKEHGLKMKIAG